MKRIWFTVTESAYINVDTDSLDEAIRIAVMIAPEKLVYLNDPDIEYDVVTTLEDNRQSNDDKQRSN